MGRNHKTHPAASELTPRGASDLQPPHQYDGLQQVKDETSKPYLQPQKTLALVRVEFKFDNSNLQNLVNNGVYVRTVECMRISS